VKRKILLPIVICLAVVASMGAASAYTARVSINADPTVGSTIAAELAVWYNTSNPIAEDVLSYTGSPDVVKVELQTVQRDSEYIYESVLQVTNQKDYGVWLCVENVSGNLGQWYGAGGTNYGDAAKNFDFKIMGHSSTTGWQCFWTNGHGGSPTEGSWGWVWLTAHETADVSFYVWAGNGAAAGDYNGTITFKAVAP
jgi:hypothetical protein